MSDFSKFVINLENRVDRRVEAEDQLNRVGWQAMFSGSVRPDSAAGFPSVGSRGCFESHLATLKRGDALDTHIIIMEDDLNFAPDFNKLWHQTIEQLKTKDWSICYPAHLMPDSPTRVQPVGANESIRCTHFMMFHRDSVAEIICGLETILSRPPGHPDGGPMHVDGAYSTIRAQNPHLKTFRFNPSLGYQRSSRSDIADVKIFDRITMLRPMMSALRRIKRLAR